MEKTWDHAINLKERFLQKKEKIYFLSRIEQEKVQELLNVQLRKGYIRLLKSPQTSPVFLYQRRT